MLVVATDDPLAPSGCAALRDLRGTPLVRWAVRAVVDARLCDRVVVVCPAAALDAVIEAVTFGAGGSSAAAPVAVVTGEGGGQLGGVIEALQAAGGTWDLIVMHDPLHALAASDLVREVVDALVEAPPEVVAVIPVRPVTDTLKWVDDEHVVQSTVDRDGFRMVYGPLAFRFGAIADELGRAPAAEPTTATGDLLTLLVTNGGHRVTTVAAPGQVFRIASAEDVVLADAMVDVGAANPSSHGRR